MYTSKLYNAGALISQRELKDSNQVKEESSAKNWSDEMNKRQNDRLISIQAK